jgi:hypothetical protein
MPASSRMLPLNLLKSMACRKRSAGKTDFFGKSLLVNGKQDEQGRALVLCLSQFGCSIRHFEKLNPTSKSELEYGFRHVR